MRTEDGQRCAKKQRRKEAALHQRRLTGTNIAPYIFIAPAVVYFICMSIIPILIAFPISLTDWSALTPDRNFVGLENYKRLFSDPLFWKGCLTTLKFFIFVPLVMMLGLGAALLLNAGLKGMKFFRVLFYSPVITSTVAAALLFEWFYQPSFGLFNSILVKLGLPPSTWLNMPDTAFWAILIFMLWKSFGANMLIYLAGLQDIPQDVKEAASIDGASGFARFWRITFPLLKPSHTYLLITNIIGVFMIFQETYTLRGNSDAVAVKTVVNYIYERGFEFFEMGYASAMSFVLFVIVMVITLIQYRGMKIDVK